MTTVAFRARFSTGMRPGMTIGQELVGQTVPMVVDGRALAVVIPSEDEGHVYAAKIGDPAIRLGLTEFTVELTQEISAPHLVYVECIPAFETATVAARRILDEARLTQPWLGLVGAEPEAVKVTATDIETGQVYEIDHPRGVVLRVIHHDACMTAIDFQRAAAGDAAEMPDILLAQARYFAHWAPDRQPGLAVLLAAVACETKIRTFLLDHSAGSTRQLLQALLKEPRTFQQPAAELFGFVAEAIVGASLRSQDRALFKRVEALFTARNALAHRADAPDADTAAQHVAAAIAAFQWLENFGDPVPPAVQAGH